MRQAAEEEEVKQLPTGQAGITCKSFLLLFLASTGRMTRSSFFFEKISF